MNIKNKGLLLLSTALLFACSESKIVNIPDGIVIPSAYTIDMKLVDYQPSNLDIKFAVSSLGGLSVSDCYVSGEARKNDEISRLSIQLSSLQCIVDEKENTTKLTGYVIEANTTFSGLPYKCAKANNCEVQSVDAVAILTKPSGLDGFSFVTKTNKEVVNFSFQNTK